MVRMRGLLFGFTFLVGTMGCRSTQKADGDASSEKGLFVPSSDNNDDYNPNYLTIDKLAEMSEGELFDIIRNKGTTLNCIPEGKSVGKPGRMESDRIGKSNIAKEAFQNLFNFLGLDTSEKVAGALWKGKVFNRNSGDCTTGKGANRIAGMKLITLTNRIFPTTEFLKGQRYLDQPEIDFGDALLQNPALENLIELNYSDPDLDPGHAGKLFGIRDIMVPIAQDDGTIIFIGRAYVGKWTTPTSFVSDGLVAWFFLDFSARALRVKGPLD
jgi:hypothetical protein